VVGTNPDALGIPFGKYHLLERLGRGGMAEVWKAKALGPMGYARKLVVKRILPELACDDEFVRMFVEEARLSASLNHRNIVQVYEFGEVGGEYYLAMEWVHGRDLNSILRTMKDRDAAPPVELAAYVTREVCRALAHAHALTDEDGQPLRLIHRDVSPSNVMLGFDGSVKLLDFGIAKALALASENRTQVGVLKGKFGYMAPEQVDADGAEVDHRADLFVAGVVLWEMLTLRRLFKGANDVQTIGMVRDARVVPPSMHNPAVPPALDAVCMRALARSRADRFADCGEMAAALDEVVHQLKFGADAAARVIVREFPNVPEPTQQLSLVAVPAAERTPSRSSTPTPVGEQIHNVPTAIGVHPSAPTKLKKAIGRLTEPTLRAWRQRERRRMILVSAVATLAVAGVLAARHPATATTTAATATRVVTVPLSGSPWLTAAVTVMPAAPALAPAVASPPSTVTIKLTTKPAGAEVTVEGETTARGSTPLTLTLTRGSDVRRLVLTAPGYQRALAEVTPDLDSRLHFELEKATRTTRRRAAPRKIKPTVAVDENPIPMPLTLHAGIRGDLN
jgi:serine/threonine protein kinase